MRKTIFFLTAVSALVILTSLASGEISLTVDGQDTDYFYIELDQTAQIGIDLQSEPFIEGIYVCIADDPVSLSNGSWTGNSNVYSPPATGEGIVSYIGYFSGWGDVWSFWDYGFGYGDGIFADFELLYSDPNNMEIELRDYMGNVVDTLTLHNNSSTPTIETDISEIHFYTTISQGDPNAKTFSITNSGPGVLNWVIDYDCSWLSVDPNSGSSTGEADTVTLNVDITGLTGGQYNCDLTIWDPLAINNPQTVSVALHMGGIIIPGKGAYTTIQDAIDAAVSGVDTVVVGDGTYTGTGNYNLDFGGKAITLRSENGPTNCIINCQNIPGRRGFYFHNGEGSDSVLEGITILNGKMGSSGGGVQIDGASPKITDCIFKNNESSQLGGGLSCYYSSALIERCVFRGNIGYGGGGISYIDSNGTISNCLIVDNIATPGSEGGGGIRFKIGYASPKVINCTIVGNTAGEGWGGGIGIATTHAVITNCVVWGNSPVGISENAGTATVSYSNVQEVFSGTENISVDPEFKGFDDYHLGFGSLCIDRGTNTPSGGLAATDLDGNLRPFDGDNDGNSITDMGAYEFYYDPGSPIVGVNPVDFYFSCPVGGPDPNSQTMGIWNGAGGILNWQITEGCDWLTVGPGTGSSIGEIDEVVLTADSTGLAADMYNCILSVFNSDDANDIRYVNIDFRVGPTLLVPSQYSTIQDAIDASFDGDEIIVADGIYQGYGNRDIDFNGKAITLRSASGDPNRCIIDCQGSSSNNHRGFYIHSCEGPDTVIEGFTIMNGYMGDGSSLPGDGGGLFILYACTSPTIVNCIVKQNTAGVSGGISCATSTPKIKDCLVSDNYAYYDYGGGISCTNQLKHVIIENCVVKNNIANNAGGGIEIRFGRAIIANSIIVKNSTEGGSSGGVFSNRYSNIIRNCTIADNAGYGLVISSSIGKITTVTNSIIWDGISGSTSILKTDYCNVLGGRSGVGNINADPGFIDPANGDYHIAANSVCVDVGDPNYSPAPNETDIDGQARVMNERIDMGADEISDMITDFDDSGSIGVPDLVTLMFAWLSQPGDVNWNPNYDANQDNVIDGGDFALLSKYWLTEIDTESPSAPANVTVAGVTNSTVSLVWDISTDNVRVAGYCVYRNGSYIGWSATAEYTDTDLDPSTPYSYTMLAYDLAYNLSPLSDLCQATTDE